MPKLQCVVLARLVNKTRKEKLAVGMGTRLYSCQENFPPVDTFNNSSHFLWYIYVDVNNPTKAMDPAT